MLEFKTDLTYVNVKIDGETYSINELTGRKREEWDDAENARIDYDMVKTSKGFEPKMKGVKPSAGRESFLISLCLNDAKNKPVEQSVIGEWNATTQKALFEECLKINGLKEVEVKND